MFNNNNNGNGNTTGFGGQTGGGGGGDMLDKGVDFLERKTGHQQVSYCDRRCGVLF